MRNHTSKNIGQQKLALVFLFVLFSVCGFLLFGLSTHSWVNRKEGRDMGRAGAKTTNQTHCSKLSKNLK